MRILVALVLLFFWLTDVAVPQVVVENHEHNSTVRYPVVLLKGAVNPQCESFTVANGEQKSRVVRTGGQFKTLVKLTEGENKIWLETRGPYHKKTFLINYVPQTNPYYVRLIWVTDKSGDTTYATPGKNDPQNYRSRLQTAATLMQTFTAEKMHDIGLPRKTFRLQRDENGLPIVHTIIGEREAEHYYQLTDQRWYREINGWLNTNHRDPLAKNMVLAAYTRKDPKTRKMKAHTALGGGNLGLFGSASVFSWPETIDDAVDVFQNSDRFDASAVHDDSSFRKTIWGLASTTIGATLHEMGHTFGLPHCTDRMGIMTRGFDHFNRAFTFSDPVSNVNQQPKEFSLKQEAYFAPVSATYLQLSSWFQLDEVELTSQQKAVPTIAHDPQSGEITISSSTGVAWVGFIGKENIKSFRSYPPSQRQDNIIFSSSEIEERMGDEELHRICVVSSYGIRQCILIESRDSNAK